MSQSYQRRGSELVHVCLLRALRGTTFLPIRPEIGDQSW